MGVMFKTFNDPRVFRDLTAPFLLKNEATHCLGLSLIDSLVEEPNLFPKFELAGFFDDQSHRLLGAAWITHPHPLGASEMPLSCVPALLDFAAGLKRKPSGIAAPFAIAEEFQRQWLPRQSCQIQRRFEQCIYELRELIAPSPLEGAMRLAEDSDQKLLAQWCWNFVVDCRMVKGPDNGNGKIYAKQAIESRSRYLWEIDGRPVSMVGVPGRTKNGARISWVYTPPEERRKGYAAHLVAKVCELEMAKRKSRCFFYTDLDNPTSNHIYQSIGFKPISKPLHYSFLY
jgi:hypothetical protein